MSEFNAGGYTFAVDGKLLATGGTSDLSNWGRAQFAKLEIGKFDGWIDEVVLRAVQTDDSRLPAVSIAAPENGSRFPLSSPIPLLVEVSPVLSETGKVGFFAGTNKIGECEIAV